MITFITGTDTDVGKTIATAALVVARRAQGRSVFVIKPVQTGVQPGEPGDLEVISGLVGGVDGAEGARLRDPLAPDVAARLEGLELPSLAAQVQAVVTAADRFDDVFVEGAGGVTVPVGAAFTLLDLADAVRRAGHVVEFVVVTRAGLGTLNHSLLTVDAIRGRGHVVAGLVVGSWPEDPDLASRSNREELPRVCAVPVLGVLPAGAGALTVEAFEAMATRALG